jgi:hypothetical protein
MANWHTTGAGQAFMRGSSDAWAEAAIAYGVDQDAAKEQATRTYAFYTGT